MELESRAPALVPRATHWWNFWICGWEAAIYIAAAQMMGPMTLIPFLFKQTGIDDAWLGLFTISALIAAVGGPIGSAWGGNRAYKLPFCLPVCFVQRLPFFAVPLGVWLLFSHPAALLWVLVGAWVASSFLGGVVEPVYHAMLTHSTRERWWGRLIGTRNVLAAAAGLATAVLVWRVNLAFTVPQNYIVLGWLGVVLLFVSYYLISRIREIPAPIAWRGERQSLGSALLSTWSIYRENTHVRWLVIARVVRSAGFVMGTYLPAFFISRCGLTEAQMWAPLALTSISEITAYTVGGWIVDRFGAKAALVMSGSLIFVNSFLLMHCYSMTAFILLYPSLSLGGSLLTIGWPTYILKFAPGEQRSAYWSAIGLASAPGSVVASIAGVVLVRMYGFEYIFYLSALGGLGSAVLFYLKVPRVRSAAV